MGVNRVTLPELNAPPAQGYKILKIGNKEPGVEGELKYPFFI
jgi:hypothetical protein